jgi:hypothetical protein
MTRPPFPPEQWKLPVTQTDLEVGYDGEAVRDGSMDVYELAPALLAIGKLVRRTSAVVNGDTATVSVRVKTAPPPGSFPIELVVILSEPENQQAMLSVDAHGLLALLGLVKTAGDGAGAISNLLELFKRLLGGKPESPPQQVAGGKYVMEIRGENVEVHQQVFHLYNDREIRQHVRDALEPVTKPGVDEFQVREDHRVVDTVTKEEATAIAETSAVAGEDADLDHGSFTKWAYVTPKSWKEENLWRFEPERGEPFSARIDDPQFWKQVQSDLVPFTPHTMLRVRVEWFQTRERDGKIRTTHVVTDVIGRRGGTDPQVAMFAGEDAALDRLPTPQELGPGRESPPDSASE